MNDNLFVLIVNLLAYPFEFFVDILEKLNFSEFFIGGVVIILSTRFILKPILGGKLFDSGSDSVKKDKG